MVATKHDQKACSSCGIAKPITEYRRRAKDSSKRFGQCRVCHNAAERDRRHKRIAEANRRHVTSLNAQLKAQCSDADVRRVCQALLAHFGGLKGFVEAWVDFYEEARRERSPHAIKCLQAIARLVQSDANSRTPSPPPTTEQLNHKYTQLLKCLLGKDPRLVATAANEVGWRLVSTQKANSVMANRLPAE